MSTPSLKMAARFAGFVAIVLMASPVGAFEFNPAGELVPGSGSGRRDSTVYVPGMTFPIEDAPAYLNSQVWGHGGYQGPGGGQCDEENYSYPWWDNFCESRSWDTPLCPTSTGHQGQDIRASTCADNTHWVVAPDDGTIAGLGSYSMTLAADDGTQYRLMHMAMDRLAVGRGDRVSAGDRLGLVSNDFGGTPTTIHLHFEIWQNVASVGGVTPVPPYASLIEAYDGGSVPSCGIVPAGGGIIDNDDPCFQLFGPSTYWRYVTGAGHGGDFYWTHGFVNDTPSNTARWTIDMAAAGRYRVEVNNNRDWIVANGFDQSMRTIYEVRHSGRDESLIVDQSAADAWVSLGEYDFAAGGSQHVNVIDNTGETGERKIVADALRLTPVGGGSCDAAECAGRGGCDAWGGCEAVGDVCARNGERQRTCTTYSCSGAECVAGAPTTEREACTPSGPAAGPWTATTACAGFAEPCGEVGEQTEEREVCEGGATTTETRTAACERDTDRQVVADWGGWGECIQTADGYAASRSRTVCSGGAASTETERQACDGPGGAPDTGIGPDAGGDGDTGGGPRSVPTTTKSDTGCSGCAVGASPVGTVWAVFLLAAAVLPGRLRQRR